MNTRYACECQTDCQPHKDCECQTDRRPHKDCECKTDVCEGIIANSLDLDIKKCDSEIRADIIVAKSKECCVRVWGQIKDCDGKPVKDALVKLLRAYYYHGKVEFEGIAHSTTDCLGFYQFDVCPSDEHVKFRILVSKANASKERVIHENGLCNPCDN